MLPLLRLTATERRYNARYTNREGKLGVLLRRYAYSVQINSLNLSDTIIHQASRRSRVFMVQFGGNTQGLRVLVQSATGEEYFASPTHIPLLVGSSPRSALSVNTGLTPPMPTTTTTTPFAVYPQKPPTNAWIIEPNIVLPGSKQLNFLFSPENPQDPVLNPNGYTVTFIVHAWEFPGYEGGVR